MARGEGHFRGGQEQQGEEAQTRACRILGPLHQPWAGGLQPVPEPLLAEPL